MKMFLSILLLFLFGCAEAKRPLLNLLPEEKEIEIGKSYVPYAIEEMDGLYPDRWTQNYVRSVGFSLAKHSDRKLPYGFYVVNSSTVNAFALPGGPVFITRGLLLKLNSESELAGVLAHELGHINARHHARFLEKQFGINLLLNIGALLVGDKPYGQLLLQFGQIGGALLTLKFSRDQEREADSYALLYTYKSGYDPMGIIRVFETFKAMEKTRPPEWLSTHPLPETRIREVREQIEKLRPSGSFITDTEDFSKLKERLKATQQSFEEFDRGKLAFSKRNYPAALEHLRKAVELYSENYVARAYLSYLLGRAGRLEEAQRHADIALQTVDSVFLTRYVHGYVSFLSGRCEQSVRSLEVAKSLIPDHADTYYYLGRCYEALGQRSKAIDNYRTAIELSRGKAQWEADARERLRRLSL